MIAVVILTICSTALFLAGLLWLLLYLDERTQAHPLTTLARPVGLPALFSVEINGEWSKPKWVEFALTKDFTITNLETISFGPMPSNWRVERFAINQPHGEKLLGAVDLSPTWGYPEGAMVQFLPGKVVMNLNNPVTLVEVEKTQTWGVGLTWQSKKAKVQESTNQGRE